MIPKPSKPGTLGLLLAGGQGLRMGGGDKCLASLGGKPLLQHVIDRATPQISELILNANGAPERFADFGLNVVTDVVENFAGPLAGVLTGMEWAARHRPDVTWIATFPTDTPFFPEDLVTRLIEAATKQKTSLSCASSGGRDHHLFGLWPMALKDDLRHALINEGLRKVSDWTARHSLARVTYPDKPFDPFFNINSPEDLALAIDHLDPGTKVS